MKSCASIQNDILRIKNEIAVVKTQAELAAIVRRRDFEALPEAAKKDLQGDVNARWKRISQ